MRLSEDPFFSLNKPRLHRAPATFKTKRLAAHDGGKILYRRRDELEKFTPQVNRGIIFWFLT